MKWIILLLFTMAGCGIAVQPATFSLAGDWAGGFSRDGSIERFEVRFDGDGGGVEGIYSIPELGLYEQPIDSLSWQSENLGFQCLHGWFDCVVDTTYREITGVNEKWQPPVRVHLRRVEAPPRLTRKSEVSISAREIALAGTLIVPACSGPHPGIVIMHGGAIQTRAEWTYRSLGEIFARHGYAALIYDKRGYGGSGGDPDPSLAEQADDGITAMKFLSEQAGISTNKVGVFVASQSGWCAPLISKTFKPAFMILNSTPAVSVAAQERQRVAYTMRQEGVSEDTIQAAIEYVELFFDVMHGKKAFDVLKRQTELVKLHDWSQFLGLAETPEDLDWFRENDYDPAADLPGLTMPILALYGEDDPLVPPELNAELLETRIRSGGNNNVRVVIFARGSHLIEDWNTLTTGEWNWPTGYWHWCRRAPGYFETVIEWLGTVH